ncbi:MAG TPA: hypothetical protein VGD40_05630 [Chryseosolibacter sp.]
MLLRRLERLRQSERVAPDRDWSGYPLSFYRYGAVGAMFRGEFPELQQHCTGQRFVT